MLALFEIAERMAGDPARPGRDVLWCSRGDDGAGGWRGGGMSRLHAAPLAVNGLIRTHLLAGRSAVLTSATLALGGTFVPLARALGLERPARRPDAAPAGAGDPGTPAPTAASALVSAAAAAEQPTTPDATPTAARPAGPPAAAATADEERPWRGLDVGSPFDYRRQGILYIAARLPAPGREPTTDAQLDEIAALVTAAGGRTLGLFSSRRAAIAAAEAMRERLDVPVLVQGDDALPTLVRQFAEDPRTCLFGTLSLWQGVDVPGTVVPARPHRPHPVPAPGRPGPLRPRRRPSPRPAATASCRSRPRTPRSCSPRVRAGSSGARPTAGWSPCSTRGSRPRATASSSPAPCRTSGARPTAARVVRCARAAVRLA